MDKASESILHLEPITFRYKKEFDPDGVTQFGLIAEEVEKVCPDLVVRDEEGKPLTVRYDAVNAMLLNEFLKEHKKVQEQGRKVQEQVATTIKLESTVAKQDEMIAMQQKQIEALTATVQKVTNQLALSKPELELVATP
jgi:endosialidase-like protein